MNILRKIFQSPSKVAATVPVAEKAAAAEDIEPLAALPSGEKSEKKKSKKSRKGSKTAVDPAMALAEARAADKAAQVLITRPSKNNNLSQKPARDGSVSSADAAPKAAMGVSRSHKKVLLDYQAARNKSTREVISEADRVALNNAKAYFLDQDWDVAIDKLSIIIESRPSWIDPWVLLMDCFFELKDWERCIELAEELSYFHPDNVSVPCYQATALRELNRTKEAILVCNQAIDLFPSSYYLLTIKGDCLFKEENFKGANESYSRALKIEKFIDGTQKAVGREVSPWARQKWRAKIDLTVGDTAPVSAVISSDPIV
jgi:tetratricopeptide (TPR) repeat protein